MTSGRRIGAAHPAVGVVVASVLFGTSGTARSFTPESASSLSIAGVRLMVGAIPLLVYGMVTDRAGRPRLRVEAVAAGLAMMLFQVCFFSSMEHSGVAVGTMVTIGSGPVIAAALDAATGRRPSARVARALLAALAGLAMLVFGTPADADGGFSALGTAFGFAAGACYAVYTMLCKRLLESGWSGTWTMAWTFAVSALSSVVLVVPTSTEWLGTPSGPVTVAYLGLVTISVAYLLYARSLSRLSGSMVVTLTLVEPVTATSLGALVLGEEIGVVSWLGAVIVVGALIVVGTGAALEASPAAVAEHRPG
ncbi:MAG: DMT family transporter [Actinomycetota bacterium]